MEQERSWMYQKHLENGELNLEWYNGVMKFIELAFNNPTVTTVRGGTLCISCPCARCDNVYSLDQDTVTNHLLHYGFRTNYFSWHKHGELHPREAARQAATNEHRADDISMMEEMIHNAAGPDVNWDDREAEQPPNPEIAKFIEMLNINEEPLWQMQCDGATTLKCVKHSVLSAVTRCLAIKAEHQLSQKCFNDLLEAVKSMLPEGEKLPKNFYECKKLVEPLSMKYKKIDVCPKFCMLYYKDRIHKDHCDVCGEPRYEPTSSNKKGKRRARKVLRYLPIIPRLKRLYMTRASAKRMRYHKEGTRENPNLVSHPADAEAWKSFDAKHPDFASEVRNVRLGLSTDGFMPYNSTAAPYSCWPVFVFPYNLPPGLLMKEDTMFLTLVLPGPTHPGRDIDICLEPLIDDLQTLWLEGAETYDVYRKEKFRMKAALLWTVSDYPAYAMLSGWGTHGEWACPYCMEYSKSFRLEHGGKPCWFDCHRCFLPEDHPFRSDRRNFKKNEKDHDRPPPMRSGEELYEFLAELDPIRWGKDAPLNQIPGYGHSHHWQKMSIFWTLPYWKTLLIRHNIDIMHLEKNFCENILFTIMCMKKTKDNPKARLDLKKLCNRPKLHLASNNTKKPLAPYELTLDKRREILKWLKEEVKFPEGYASNWSRCINLSKGTITGLKSHDYHVFMERILPAAFRDYIPDPIWDALCEISAFFREICAKELDMARITKLENDIVVTLCKLEKHFPPGFFDSMEHLVVHVAYEARMGGPIGCRWMYPVERRNKEQRMRVTNKARVEASIVEATIVKEIATYCMSYFAEKNNSKDGGEVNGAEDRLSVFASFGQPLGRARERILQLDEYKAAHNCVILNCPEIEHLLREFDEVMITNGQVSTASGSLDAVRDKEFANWLSKKNLSHEIDDRRIRNLCLRPLRRAKCYEGYETNGFRFHTDSYSQHKTTVNSGVCVTGEILGGTQNDYYGVLKEVIELEYEGVGNKVFLFKCHWFDITNGVRNDPQHGLVEVKHTSTLPGSDPFMLACQATQVYYLPYASRANRERQQWWIATKVKRKGNLGLEEMDDNADFFQEEGPNCPLSVSIGQDFDWDSLVIEELQYETVTPEQLSRRATQQMHEDGGGTEDLEEFQYEEYYEAEDEIQEEGEQLETGGSDEEDWNY